MFTKPAADQKRMGRGALDDRPGSPSRRTAVLIRSALDPDRPRVFQRNRRKAEQLACELLTLSGPWKRRWRRSGWGGYSYLGEGWSARGTASLHIQHVGSDQTLWEGNPILLLDRLDGAADEREAIERTRDVSFGLDRLLSRDSPFHAAIDRKRIVAAGHSYGANTTLILTGAQVIRDGKPVGHRDPRFTASIVISAPPFYGEADLAAVLASVNVPTLHVTTTEDTIRIPGRYSPVQDRVDVFNAVPTAQKALVVFQGGSHSVFTDRSLRNGGPLNPLVKRATAEAGLAFLELVHRSDPIPVENWSATWKPILAAAPVLFPVLPRQVDRRRRT